MALTNSQTSSNSPTGDPDAPSSQKPEKIIVAVHGIGDQFQFATIQSVATRFCASYKNPLSLPLGKFYDECIGKPPETYLLQMAIGEDPTTREKIGFAEIYWADIPRIPEKAGYTLEESKKWARTVIDRLRPLCGKGPNALTLQDLEMAKGLLDEMIDTISVLETLFLLAEKAGLFKFNLKEVLIDYLGDVQLVTDFKKYRDMIVHRFFAIMNHIHAFNPNAGIYIVAHSEGTVVAFLSLLEAICGTVPQDVEADDRQIALSVLSALKAAGLDVAQDAEEKLRQTPDLTCDWLSQVKGLMTIGSPIDKHLILWPDIWKKYETCGKVNLPIDKIHWRNYYDYGDPVGFRLNTAHDWLCDKGYGDIFDFPYSHDHGFGRYLFPGKAHNDYWTDTDVFDHFIDRAVKPKPIPRSDPPTMSLKDEPPEERPQRPPDRFWRKLGGNVLPYVIMIGLIAVGVYFMQKAVNEFDGVDRSFIEILRNVSGITCLLIGLTLVAQIPRLTRSLMLRVVALVLFAISTLGYGFITTQEVRDRLGCFLTALFVHRPSPWASTLVVIALASLIAISVFLTGLKSPRKGLQTLLLLSLVGMILTVGITLLQSSPCAPDVAPQPDSCCHTKSVWPLFLATAAFLYLWWLAALVFDLVVVWHYYIRQSKVMERLQNWHNAVKLESKKEQLES